jgi:hypothetical protein
MPCSSSQYKRTRAIDRAFTSSRTPSTALSSGVDTTSNSDSQSEAGLSEDTTGSDSDEDWKALDANPWEDQWHTELAACHAHTVPAGSSHKAAEYCLNRPVDHAGGAKDKTGKKRGIYCIRGGSRRTIERSRTQIREYAKEWPGGLENPTIKRCLAMLEVQKDVRKGEKMGEKKQQSMLSFFGVLLQIAC